MAKGNILKEAIADAKTVREVALQNAKSALEEAFTPKLQNMLSAKLSEDLDEMYYDEDEKDMDEMYYDEDEKDMDEDMDEGHGMYDEDEKDSMDEEIDLEEILNELELEEGKKADKEEVDEAKHADDDDKKEEQLDEMGRPIFRGEDVKTQHTYKAEYVNEDQEFDLDTLLNEINSLDKKEKAKKFIQPKSIKANVQKINERRNAGCKQLNTAFLNSQEELKETQKALKNVKNELNEVNLLNSKLLYVNRIFKANTLDDSQKLRVVETLDKAGSVKEAKLIYETIKDSFIISNSKKIKRNSRKKPISENLGMASRAAGNSTAPKKEIISESNNMMARFQKLANIKINE